MAYLIFFFLLLLTTTATTTGSPPVHQDTNAGAHLPTLVTGATLVVTNNFTVNSARLVIKPAMSQNAIVSVHGLDRLLAYHHFLFTDPVSASGVKSSSTWQQVAAAAVVVGLLVLRSLKHGSSAGTSQGNFRYFPGPLTFLLVITTFWAMLSPVGCDLGDDMDKVHFDLGHEKSAIILLAITAAISCILFFVLVVLAIRYYCLFKFRTIQPEIEMLPI